MTFSEAQTRLIQQLTDRYGAGEATSIVRIVLEDAFQCRLPVQNRSMTVAEIDRFETLSARLEAGEPVQYVLGEADFFGLKFLVTPAVLIPRQETEELVAQVLQYLKSSGLDKPVLLDIGLGSGCIGLTLRKKHPGLRLYGLEKSAEALAVARENAGRLLGSQSAGVTLLQGDILDRDTWSDLPAFDVVVSNPPYIPAAEKHLVPEHVQAHEPWLALFVEHDDPLLFYRVIAEFALEKLHPGGALFFECNEFNAAEAAEMLRAKGFLHVQLQKDLYGADRMIAAHKSL
jgi:release factor glutamine methyltransferase